jgi:hypothetical protein
MTSKKNGIPRGAHAARVSAPNQRDYRSGVLREMSQVVALFGGEDRRTARWIIALRCGSGSKVRVQTMKPELLRGSGVEFG